MINKNILQKKLVSFVYFLTGSTLMAGVRRVVSTDRARSRSDFRDRDSELRDADDDVVEEDDDGFSGDSSYRLFKLFPVYFF